MRVFYFVKFAQGLLCYTAIALSLAPMRLCGKASLDRALSMPGTSCAKYLLGKDVTLISELLGGDVNTTFGLSHFNESNGTEADRRSGDQPGGYEARLESFTCIELDWTDLTCFTWSQVDRLSPCGALSFALLVPMVLVVELLFLLSTSINVFCTVGIPPKKTDCYRSVIHLIIWLVCLHLLVYRYISWQDSWSNLDFQPEFPGQWVAVMVLCVTSIAWYAAELLYIKCLYTKVKLHFYADEMADDVEMPYLENNRSYVYSLRNERALRA